MAVEAVRAMVGDFFLRQGRDLAWLDANLACDEFGVNCSMCEHCSLRDQRVSCALANRASVRLFRVNRIATACVVAIFYAALFLSSDSQA
ncbi:MAG: hypothetical protein ACLTQI_01985 [Slackia sp.]